MDYDALNLNDDDYLSVDEMMDQNEDDHGSDSVQDDSTSVAESRAPHMIFTGLEDYKARGTQAAPYLTSTFYTELSETKDLVFIRGGEVDHGDSSVVLLEQHSVQASGAVQ
ncbi:hypothetical protein Bca101_017511 [Brassica carinata]